MEMTKRELLMDQIRDLVREELQMAVHVECGVSDSAADWDGADRDLLEEMLYEARCDEEPR